MLIIRKISKVLTYRNPVVSSCYSCCPCFRSCSLRYREYSRKRALKYYHCSKIHPHSKNPRSDELRRLETDLSESGCDRWCLLHHPEGILGYQMSTVWRTEQEPPRWGRFAGWGCGVVWSDCFRNPPVPNFKRKNGFGWVVKIRVRKTFSEDRTHLSRVRCILSITKWAEWKFWRKSWTKRTFQQIEEDGRSENKSELLFQRRKGPVSWISMQQWEHFNYQKY